MNDAQRRRYLQRMQRALDHADAHLDEALDVATLAQAAYFSPYHFHRQFGALFGVTVHQYVQAARMKKAAWGLAFRPEASITHWALATGYATPDGFSKAFRQYVGSSPRAFRTRPDWLAWRARHGRDQPHPETSMRFQPTLADVRIIEFPATPVAVLEHCGDPALLPHAIRRFIAWRRLTGLTPRVSATYNLLYNDPWVTPPEEFRLALCAGLPVAGTPGASALGGRPDGPAAHAGTDGATAAPASPDTASGIVLGEIPGGRCALLRQVGSPDDLRPGLDFLFGTWLPQSGETLRDAPVFAQRVSFFPDVPESQAITDLFLPLC